MTYRGTPPMIPTDEMIEAGDQVLGEYWALKCAARQGAVRRIYTAMESARDPDELRETLEEVARLKLIIQAYVDPAEVRADLLPLVTAINEEPFTALSRNRGDVGHG